MPERRSQNRAARVLINTAAYHHNLQRVRELVPASQIMAVIKADGYGHGMITAANALAQADEFGVTGLDDVRRLRNGGITKPLTLLSSRFTASELATFSAGHIRPVIYDHSQLPLLEALPSDAALNIWLKVDTGMGRLGFAIEEIASLMPRLLALPGVAKISLMTHLANADDKDHSINQHQFDRFNALIGQYDFDQLSALNSAGVVNFPLHGHDMTRPGLMLYGIAPTLDTCACDLGLSPVMTFTSELISVRSMKAGSTIGYGSTVVLRQDSRIGVIAAGYGDGYPRHAPTGTPVFINGVSVPLIGRVSMDLITVDLSDSVAEVGDDVVLWGEKNPIEVIARMAGTIAYELSCGITDRVERIVR